VTSILKDVNLALLKKVEIWKWTKEDGGKKVEAHLSIEEPLALELNGKTAAILMRLPGNEKELAVGFCISEGLVKDFKDIVLVHHCGSLGLNSPASEDGVEQRNVVKIKTTRETVSSSEDLAMLLVRSGCGRTNLDIAQLDLPVCRSQTTVEAKSLGRMLVLLAGEQKLKHVSGGVHSAVLFDQKEQIICSYEDVGRHNAMDKAIGYALMRDIPLDDKIALISGRASYEMITKAARVGIPIMLSISLPTSLAVEYADKCGITLVGGLRQGKFNVYSHPNRILF